MATGKGLPPTTAEVYRQMAGDVMEEFEALVEAIRERTPRALSSEIIRSRPPHRATWHCVLDGKEYMVIVIPTDLPDPEPA